MGGDNKNGISRSEYRLLISDIPEGERPRERFMEIGASAMSQRELLAIILRTGIQGVGVLQLADQLLKEFDGLAGLARTDLRDLQRIPGIGPVKAIEIKTVLELGKRLAMSTRAERYVIKTPGDAAQLLMLEMSMLEQEEVRIMLLDTRNGVIGIPQIYRGSLNSASIRIGEVFKEAIRSNAATLVFAHNHPSGDPTPSAEDIKVTDLLVKAGKLLDIEVLDHIIISHNRYVSLKERGVSFE